jgi:hypothetical protein
MWLRDKLIDLEGDMVCGRIQSRQGRLVTLLLILWTALFLLYPAVSRVSTAAAQSVYPTDELIREATFIFRGTVEKSGASTMPAVKAGPSTAVVRVDQIIEGPGAPPDLVGRGITVQLLEPGAVKVGSQAVFFTRGWLLGNSIAVIEVGSSVAPTEASRVAALVKSTRQTMADERLQQELATADAVVLGKVNSVGPATIPHLRTEHDPDWYEARILVESVLKGQVRGREVTVLFANSQDPQWYDSPKFREGQQGIWVLHRNQLRLPGIENQYTIVRSLDFQSREEIGRVERLAKGLQ